MKMKIIGVVVFLASLAGFLAPGREWSEPAQPVVEDFSPAFLEMVDGAQDALLAASAVEEKLRGAANLEAAKQDMPEFAAVGKRLSSGKDTGEKPGIVEGIFEKGSTLADILEDAGNGNIRDFVTAAAKVFSPRSFRAGQPWTVYTDPATGRIRRFEYEVDDKSRLVVEGVDKPKARLEELKLAPKLAVCRAKIDDNLFQAVADIGESPQLAVKLVELFGSEINFIRNIRPGDSFSILIEKLHHKGAARGYGRILAAKFTNRGKTHEAWLFRDPDGELRYYNSRGENLEKTLMMAPLAVTRLTSKFTHAREHPILGGLRPHLGVDYAAPVGTPVKAVGNGTVVKREWAGGYGNQVVIRHDANLESMYSHLSGYARDLREGQKVRQGQVIGFVGSTGMSTGPHLDFRLRQKGEFINPAKVINPRGAPVDDGLMATFKKVMEKEKAYLNGAKLPSKYTVDSVVPARVKAPVTLASMESPGKYRTGAGRRGWMLTQRERAALEKRLARAEKFAREKGMSQKERATLARRILLREGLLDAGYRYVGRSSHDQGGMRKREKRASAEKLKETRSKESKKLAKRHKRGRHS